MSIESQINPISGFEITNTKRSNAKRVTSIMLLFYCTSLKDLPEILKNGIEGPVTLYGKLEEAEAKCTEVILVVHGFKVEVQKTKKNSKVIVRAVPVEAILNANPYLPPSKITAGGGYVIRKGKKGPEVLMILRKGVWDLPKGKLDEGETIEECALREVREEVGIKKLKMKANLGVTVHGYVRKNKYKVKTTYWYQMETPEDYFTPQAEEDIEAVKWMAWAKAVDSVGYDIFRRHMNEIETLIQV